MRPLKASAAILFAAGIGGLSLAGGCKNPGDQPPPPPAAGPTTINTPMGNMRTGIPQTMPVDPTPAPGPTTTPTPPAITGTQSREPAVTTAPASVTPPVVTPPVVTPPVVTPPPATTPAVVTPPSMATHVLTMDEPYYKAKPMSGAKPDGTLKAGTKVLLVIPGSPTSEVMTEDKMSVYTVTDGLDPISKK